MAGPFLALTSQDSTVRPSATYWPILASDGTPGDSDDDPGMDVDGMIDGLGSGDSQEGGDSEPPPPPPYPEYERERTPVRKPRHTRSADATGEGSQGRTEAEAGARF